MWNGFAGMPDKRAGGVDGVAGAAGVNGGVTMDGMQGTAEDTVGSGGDGFIHLGSGALIEVACCGYLVLQGIWWKVDFVCSSTPAELEGMTAVLLWCASSGVGLVVSEVWRE